MADPEPTHAIHDQHGGYEGEFRELDGVTLVICQTCHYIEAHCMHAKNTWSADGKTLTCDFCGIDGT
jgi:hypothetical protein